MPNISVKSAEKYVVSYVSTNLHVATSSLRDADAL